MQNAKWSKCHTCISSLMPSLNTKRNTRKTSPSQKMFLRLGCVGTTWLQPWQPLNMLEISGHSCPILTYFCHRTVLTLLSSAWSICSESVCVYTISSLCRVRVSSVSTILIGWGFSRPSLHWAIPCLTCKKRKSGFLNSERQFRTFSSWHRCYTVQSNVIFMFEPLGLWIQLVWLPETYDPEIVIPHCE